MTIPQIAQRPVQTLEMRTHEVDIELLTFVERYATNLAKWDLLVFFGRNPAARENAFSIAHRIGRRTSVIEKELNDLVYLGILRARENEHDTLYELTRLSETRRTVTRLARRSVP
ncbi:MAG: hypothetical protein HY868_09985 [Chloroflexi bacterium]|nr:hypothetical protein [Chloroflexota bacterium]